MSNEQNSQVIRTQQIEVRGRTLVFQNTVYQISNIASMSAGTIINYPSRFFWTCLLLGAIALPIAAQFGNESLFAVGGGFLSLAVISFIFYLRNWRIRGLFIWLNSGTLTTIYSKDIGFIKNVIYVLQSIMDKEDEERSLTVNLDQRTIVDNVSGSTIVMGSMQGNIAHNV